jgi:hypothetical protein
VEYEVLDTTAAPVRNAKRSGVGGLRQTIESVNGKLVQHFRLDKDRPHTLDGFAARLAAKVALHNACCWLNRHRGRPTLAFADLLSWYRAPHTKRCSPRTDADR